MLSEPVNESPVPICPSRLDVHTREAPTRAPSSASLPDPLKSISSAGKKVDPSAGLVMVAVGGVLMITATDALPVAPWLSVAVRVMV